MSSSIERLLRAWLIFVLATPLIFGTELLYPFIVYRTYFFFFVVSGAFVLFISRHGFSWLSSFKTNPQLRAIGVFVAAVALSDILGVNPWFSFWGNYERMMGLLLLLHLVAYLIMLVSVFRSVAQYRMVLMTSVVSSTLVAMYGLLQSSGLAFRINQIDERLFSTIGNPAFLAGFR